MMKKRRKLNKSKTKKEKHQKKAKEIQNKKDQNKLKTKLTKTSSEQNKLQQYKKNETRKLYKYIYKDINGRK